MHRSIRCAIVRPMARAPNLFTRVHALVKRIPPGRVATYGQLSELIDGRLSPVAIGWALRAAAEGAIPWHRVVNAKGTLSTERENPGLQRAMLESEGVRFTRDGHIDLEIYQWRRRQRRSKHKRIGSHPMRLV
jgi:methylated-DNA-protein-cysteine methyltransferase-like protein